MKPRRFRRRARTELVAQPEAALVEQPKRFGGVPHADMEPHDLLIRCFPAGFDLDDLAGILNRDRQLAGLGAERGEALEPPDQDGSESLALPFDPWRLV